VLVFHKLRGWTATFLVPALRGPPMRGGEAEGVVVEQSLLRPSPTSGTSYIRVLLRIHLPRTPMNKGIKRRAPQVGRTPALYFRALLTEGGDQRVQLHRA
jgi:hypothetical protein